MGDKVIMQRLQAPCWDCKKFAGGCSWSRSFEPVPGWKAKKVKIKYCRQVSYETYEIRKCPEFEHD